ncbi:nitronate monooxygenase, partial [Staphylococcus capitis]|uniref:nitronate monooxygenase n=1 Tax=Staphylococcus capitis TaxID=29388 RepID=UPI0028CBAEEF
MKSPIIQPPIPPTTTPQLLSTLTKQAPLPIIPAAYFHSHQLSKHILQLQKLTQPPFPLNLFTPNHINYHKKQIHHINTKLKPY